MDLIYSNTFAIISRNAQTYSTSHGFGDCGATVPGTDTYLDGSCVFGSTTATLFLITIAVMLQWANLNLVMQWYDNKASIMGDLWLTCNIMW